MHVKYFAGVFSSCHVYAPLHANWVYLCTQHNKQNSSRLTACSHLKHVVLSLKRCIKNIHIHVFCLSHPVCSSHVLSSSFLHHLVQFPLLSCRTKLRVRGSSLLVTSANCPDGPASLLLFNTSVSVGVCSWEHTGSCHVHELPPQGYWTPPWVQTPCGTSWNGNGNL